MSVRFTEHLGMSDLANTEDLAILLGLTDADADAQGDTLQFLADRAETLFLAAINRTDLPFKAAQVGRVEVHEGTHSYRLWLDYAVASVTEIILGPNLAMPTETLDPTDPAIVHVHVGARQVLRMDGKTWRTTPVFSNVGPDMNVSFVQVTYTTQADVPDDVEAAILEMAAELYRGLGTSGVVTSERLDNYSVSFAKQTTTLTTGPLWVDAVARHRRLASI